MVSVSKHKRGGYYLEVRPLPGVRKLVYLGKIPKAFAERVKANVVRIQQAAAMNFVDTEMVLWSSGISDSLREKLVAAGVPMPAKPKSWLVSDWLTYVTTNYPGKPRTRKNLETARKHWDGYLGMKELASVTPGDVRSCVERILATAKPSHAAKLCERGRMYFERAVEHKLIAENPFVGLKFGDKRQDKTRQQYISKSVVATVIKNATSQEARALIALARYCGLRVPSEPLAITWADVDWDLRRLRIPSDTKTGERALPLFEAYDELRKLFDQAPDGASYVFARARASAETTWRDWLKSAIIASKIPVWEKLWVNLRASCRTDLDDAYPAHVCDSWLGHSSRVAKDHYSMVSPEHWDKAARTGGEARALGGALGPNVSEVVPGGSD